MAVSEKIRSALRQKSEQSRRRGAATDVAVQLTETLELIESRKPECLETFEAGIRHYANEPRFLEKLGQLLLFFDNRTAIDLELRGRIIKWFRARGRLQADICQHEDFRHNLRHPDPEVRRCAAELIGFQGRGARGFARALFGQLHDAEPRVRAAVLVTLSQLAWEVPATALAVCQEQRSIVELHSAKAIDSRTYEELSASVLKSLEAISRILASDEGVQWRSDFPFLLVRTTLLKLSGSTNRDLARTACDLTAVFQHIKG